MKKVFWMLASLFLFLSGATAQDSLRQRARDKSGIQKRDRIHQEDHLLFQDGKLYRVQQGVRTQVQEQVRLQNGGVVYPDGTYQLKDRQRQQLRSGECLDMSGNRYLNQNRFNQRRMISQGAIDRMRQPGMNRQGAGGNRRGRGGQ